MLASLKVNLFEVHPSSLEVRYCIINKGMVLLDKGHLVNTQDILKLIRSLKYIAPRSRLHSLGKGYHAAPNSEWKGTGG